MKRVVWFFAGMTLACGCVTETEAPEKVAPVDYVVFVGLDGLSARSVMRVNPPTFRRLMNEGAWTLESRSMLPSSSSCNWRSVFACAASEQHGFVAWNSREPAFAVSEVNESGLFPDIFSELARQRPSAESVFIYEWSGMKYTVDTNAVTKLMPSANHAATKKSLPEAVAAMKRGFLSAVINSPDDVGHKFGWDSPEYDKRVVELDALVGEVMAAIESSGKAERTVLVVTSDHGGEGKKHGRATLSDMERPVFIWGANVRKGRRLEFGGTVYDTGATLAALLDLDFPKAWIGRPFAEAFETSPIP